MPVKFYCNISKELTASKPTTHQGDHVPPHRFKFKLRPCKISSRYLENGWLWASANIVPNKKDCRSSETVNPTDVFHVSFDEARITWHLHQQSVHVHLFQISYRNAKPQFWPSYNFKYSFSLQRQAPEWFTDAMILPWIQTTVRLRCRHSQLVDAAHT